MIKLNFKAEFAETVKPFVGKLAVCDRRQAELVAGHDAEITCCYDKEKGGYRCKAWQSAFFIACEPEYDFDGDVFLFIPEKKAAQRLIRRKSQHNTILFTEQCDERCVMCSQPPRMVDDRWLLPLYAEAINLADTGTQIGISGGEPTLYKNELFSLLEDIGTRRSDLSFHILSNAQHFSKEDRQRLRDIHSALNVLWGVPLYSASAQEHDEIVRKPGAFDVLIKNLFILASSGGAIEMRTVLMKRNIVELPYLAKFITTHCHFIAFWAIMSLEPIGYAKYSRDDLFFDYSQFFVPVANAIEIAKLYNLPVSLYNFPLCTIPKEYREYCVDSISDWKKKYLNVCDPCTQKDKCAGFFEWYNPDWELVGVKPFN